MRFDRRVVSVPPGRARQYVEADWRDALVVVARGEVELEARGGTRRSFPRGAVLSLAGLPLRALHNHGDEPVELVAVRRRRAGRAEPAGR
jgi:hypothetical protein